jgi:hypothetical protein
MRILQVFADIGAENPALSRYGNITRVSREIEENQWSTGIEAEIIDVESFPIDHGETFDIGWFHPPCGGVSPMSDTGNGSREEWPDLIPLSREIAKQYCDHYVIENKPRESINPEVTLDGHMFELGIEYKRAFEASFPIEQPPKQKKLAETSPFYYSEKRLEWWLGVKGTSRTFPKQHIAKNTIPAAYIDYIMRYYGEYVDVDDRPDYTDYNTKMETKRSKSKNQTLTEWEDS